MKSGSIGKDIIQVVGIGLVLTVILTVIGVAASLAIGVPGSADASGTPVPGNQIVLIPTSIPPTATPTEIPCTAQEWWTANSTAAGDVFTKVRNVTVTSKVPDIRKDQLALQEWKIQFTADDAPPCVGSAKTAVINASQAADEFYKLFTTTATDQQRAQQTIQLADKLLVVYDELDKLKVDTTDAWLVEAKDYSRGECPAARWYTEQFIGKGYREFITTNPKLNVTKMTTTQMTDLLKQFRNLQSSLNIDKDKFPECVNTQALDYLVTYFKAGADALNSALNGDLASVQGSLTLMPTALNSFYATMKTLDPKLTTP